MVYDHSRSNGFLERFDSGDDNTFETFLVDWHLDGDMWKSGRHPLGSFSGIVGGVLVTMGNGSNRLP